MDSLAGFVKPFFTFMSLNGWVDCCEWDTTPEN